MPDLATVHIHINADCTGCVCFDRGLCEAVLRLCADLRDVGLCQKQVARWIVDRRDGLVDITPEEEG